MAQDPKKPRQAVSPAFRNPPPKDPGTPDEAPPEPQPETLASESLAPEDKFVLASSRMVDWTVRHRGALLGAIGLLVVVGIGGALYASYREGQNLEAAGETYKVLQKLPEAQGERLNLPTVEASLTDEDRAARTGKYREAAQKLESIADAYGGLSAAGTAQLYAGYSYLMANDHAQALKSFQEGADMVEAPPLEYFALNGMVAAQSAAGDTQGAVATLRRMTEELPGVWKETALLDLGRTLEGEGDTAAAAATYETLVQSHPSSAFVTDARERLQVLKPDSPALAPAKPAEGAAPAANPEAAPGAANPEAAAGE